MVIFIQEVSWDFTILDGCVSPFFSQIPTTYFVPFGHLLKMWWWFSPRLRKSWYRDCLPWPCDPAILASVCLVSNQVTEQRAGSLWLSERIYQEHGRGLYVPSMESFECGTQIYFFFAISQYILIINPHYLGLPEYVSFHSVQTERQYIKQFFLLFRQQYGA